MLMMKHGKTMDIFYETPLLMELAMPAELVRGKGNGLPGTSPGEVFSSYLYAGDEEDPSNPDNGDSGVGEE